MALSHPSRVRGLKHIIGNDRNLFTLRSHPSRVRGLKRLCRGRGRRPRLSHPSRVRGLKHDLLPHSGRGKWVAPLTGAWIETRAGPVKPNCVFVAPLTGAWIETSSLPIWWRWKIVAPRVRGLKPAARCQYPRSSRSHPSRVRGLKHWDDATASYPWFVAPLTGAWIETPLSPHGRMSGCCRTPHGCVD